MRVVGYLRVSTDRQAEEGLGLGIQEAAIREWVEANGHEIDAIYKDEGISGSNGIETRGVSARLLSGYAVSEPGASSSTGSTGSRVTSCFRSRS